MNKTAQEIPSQYISSEEYLGIPAGVIDPSEELRNVIQGRRKHRSLDYTFNISK